MDLPAETEETIIFIGGGVIAGSIVLYYYIKSRGKHAAGMRALPPPTFKANDIDSHIGLFAFLGERLARLMEAGQDRHELKRCKHCKQLTDRNSMNCRHCGASYFKVWTGYKCRYCASRHKKAGEPCPKCGRDENGFV